MFKRWEPYPRTEEMDEQVRVLAVPLEDLGLSPSTHMVANNVTPIQGT